MTTTTQDYGPLKPDIFQILLALEAGPLHGYGIIESVEARTRSQQKLLPSLLYRRLARLVEGEVVRQHNLVAVVAISKEAVHARKRTNNTQQILFYK